MEDCTRTAQSGVLSSDFTDAARLPFRVISVGLSRRIRAIKYSLTDYDYGTGKKRVAEYKARSRRESYKESMEEDLLEMVNGNILSDVNMQRAKLKQWS